MIPLCRAKNDSVKNKLIIRIAKQKCIKSLFFNAFNRFTDTISTNKTNPKMPISAKI